MAGQEVRATESQNRRSKRKFGEMVSNSSMICTHAGNKKAVPYTKSKTKPGSVDFISILHNNGLEHVAEIILSYLDADSLIAAEVVSTEWLRAISERMLWKKHIDCKILNNSYWRRLAERRNCMQYFLKPCPRSTDRSHSFYRDLFSKIMTDAEITDDHWKTGNYMLRRINCQSEDRRGVYFIHSYGNKIVCGLRDRVIKIWNKTNLQCLKTLKGHTGSVLCLQFDDKVIISGSSDNTVRVWNIETGEVVNILTRHNDSILHLRFDNEMLVTCSMDHTIAVWDRRSPSQITLRHLLVGHTAAVNIIEFDERYIISGSSDNTIKAWSTSSGNFVRTIRAHMGSVMSLHYRYPMAVSGSTDESIKIWNIESGSCLRILRGHHATVRCLQFDSKRIVSADYDGNIKVWDLDAALDPSIDLSKLCLNTFVEHTNRVFCLQIDESQIISCALDDTILIWDFLHQLD